MRENKVKRSLGSGGVALGTIIFEFSTTGIARIAASAGCEFVMFDLEHTGWSMDTLRMLLATARAADIVPLVRVPALEYHFVSRALDLGALGVMVPMIETGEQAKALVQFAKYPPVGKRGAAFGVGHDDYKDGDLAEKMRSANEETLLIALVETARGVENVDAIAAVEGIDVVWVGHYDLTGSMGIPGQFESPRFISALQRVVAASRRHGKACGFMVSDAEDGRVRLAQGFRVLCYLGDVWLYRQALTQGISALRALLPQRGGTER